MHRKCNGPPCCIRWFDKFAFAYSRNCTCGRIEIADSGGLDFSQPPRSAIGERVAKWAGASPDDSRVFGGWRAGSHVAFATARLAENGSADNYGQDLG